jgi:hypothetical protein
VTVTLLGATSAALALLLFPPPPGASAWPWLQALVVGAALFGGLVARRQRPTTRIGSAAFLLMTASLLVAIWVTQSRLVARGLPWQPFQGEKLGAVGVALIAPAEPWVGATCILSYGVTAVAQYFTFPDAVRARLPVGEPGMTVLYALIAIGVLAQRVHAARSEQRRLAAEAEAAAIEQLARAVIALRDLANTPLQTLELAVGLLRRQHPEATALTGPMERALVRLRELNRLAAAHESGVRWRPGEESFDPLAQLQRR